ncbi:MAG: DUF4236 domain-containing protein [Candidatus Hydrogenedentota bacterium]|nr:MAG: DUF4236 domain-containing protein [Candidatus Hydrogenedentota bacterium]
MAYRFWRRIKIAPGITLNLSKSGASISVGTRGAKVTFGPRGTRVTTGIPGTGLYYTTTLNQKSSRKQQIQSRKKSDKLTLNFFERIVTPDDEEAFVDGLKEYVQGNPDKAIESLKKATHLADGAWILGAIYIVEKKNIVEAEKYFQLALEKATELGKYFSKYDMSGTLEFQITPEVSAYIQPNLRGALLILVEIYQAQKKDDQAIACLNRLRRLEPNDILVKLSLAEYLYVTTSKDNPNSKKTYQKIVKLAEGIQNKSHLHTALLFYKAKALHLLGLLSAARDTLTYALRRKKNRPKDLLLALRYERACIYEKLGQAKRARTEFEKIYAEDPDYEDVAAKLGVA